MTDDIKVTKLRLVEGVWHGAVQQSGQNDQVPEIDVTHLGDSLEGVEVVQDHAEGYWALSIPIPADCISDGVQTFVIRDARNDVVLDSFSIVAGDALAEDIRAETSLLRAELDMLKKAFRRHCAEVAARD